MKSKKIGWSLVILGILLFLASFYIFELQCIGGPCPGLILFGNLYNPLQLSIGIIVSIIVEVVGVILVKRK